MNFLPKIFVVNIFLLYKVLTAGYIICNLLLTSGQTSFVGHYILPEVRLKTELSNAAYLNTDLSQSYSSCADTLN